MIRLQYVRLGPVFGKLTASSLVYAALLTVGMLAIWFSAPRAQSANYKWVDETGQIHYSEIPPQSSEFQVITPRPSSKMPNRPAPAEKQPSPSFDQKDQKLKKSDEKVQTTANNEQIRKKNCAAATHNLNTLQSRGRLRIFDGKDYRILSPEEQETKISQAKTHIEQFCD